MICDIGIEAWSVKEARASEHELPEWGAQKERAPLWEATTAYVYLLAGADILVLRHPKAVASVREAIKQLMGDGLR
jgi:acetyl-CoA decarbonylase/synthase complex subunit delta